MGLLIALGAVSPFAVIAALMDRRSRRRKIVPRPADHRAGRREVRTGLDLSQSDDS